MASTRVVMPYAVVSWYRNRSSIAELIRARFPQEFKTYYEPMVGGCGVFLGVQHSPSVIADRNRWLMDTYWALRDDYKRVVEILECLVPTVSVYDRVKKMDPRGLELPFRAAHLIFLSRMAFKNDFRVNHKGQFNVRFGRPRRFVYREENLKAFSERLAGVDLQYGDFEETVKAAQPGDFVYFDPPPQDKRVSVYSGAKGRTRFRFTEKDYLRFAATCTDLDRRGVKWAVTDNNTTMVRLALCKFNVTPLVRSEKDGEIEVVLITNYTVG